MDGASGTSDVGLYDGGQVFVSRVEECNEAWLGIGALRVMSRTFVCWFLALDSSVLKG